MVAQSQGVEGSIRNSCKQAKRGRGGSVRPTSVAEFFSGHGSDGASTLPDMHVNPHGSGGASTFRRRQSAGSGRLRPPHIAG